MDSFHGPITFAALLLVVGLLIFSSLGADAILLGALVLLLICGVLSPEQAIIGFANQGMLTVAALFVVAAGVRRTGAMAQVASLLLGNGHGRKVRSSLVRLTLPVAALSALLNNTPIVAALVPAVTDWCRRHQLSASLFLLPLSYATILGGTLTLIGTSTNLVVAGLIESHQDVPGLSSLGIFSIFPVGLAVATAGCLVLVFVGPWVLPKRQAALSRNDDPRLYTSEFLVGTSSTLVGKSIEEAGLRHLPGSYLAEVVRGAAVLSAVEPTTRLFGGDRLVFVGPRESVVDLQRIAGLVPAPDEVSALDAPAHERCLVDAVVAPGNPAVGHSIRESEFRAQFQAVVVAVARDGDRIRGRIGDIVLEPGDVLLLDCSPSWVATQQNRRDFYLVTEVPDSSTYRHDRAFVSLAILLAMVLIAALEWLPMFTASVLAATAMVLSGCLSGNDGRRSIELPVLVTIAAAFGLGEAVRESGLDRALAKLVLSLVSDNPWAALCGLYLTTALLTELVTNNAAAALMFPFALSVAAQLEVSPMPLVVSVMFAASASFATPMGYQTNLMVYGPGGYRFTDFLRLGIPLQISCAVVSCTLIPRIFPF